MDNNRNKYSYAWYRQWLTRIMMLAIAALLVTMMSCGHRQQYAPLAQKTHVDSLLNTVFETDDQVRVIEVVAKHLIEQGYKRIGTLAGYMNSEAYVARLEGYRKALMGSGLPVDESLVYYDTILRDTGFDAALKAIDAGCDALYCSGDFCALGAIQAAQSKGLRIPADFGVVGTADESFTALMSPSMSSLALNPLEMGRQAAQAFLSGEDGTVVVPMELKERESSCKRMNHYV